jgi:hypothetical protein
MEITLLILRLALAGVFAVAAIAKLIDRTARIMPAVELVVAGLLVAAPRPYGALVALALVAGFNLAIALRVWRGVKSPCRCFGRRFERSLGTWVVTRNTLLSIAALMVLAVRP